MTLNKTQRIALLGSLLVLSACAILYELLISTVSSYLLGSSVLHFSLTIGFFLSFLGVGAWLSKYLHAPLLPKFLFIELLLGLAGGFSALTLFLGNAWFPNYYIVLIGCISVIGTLAGMEIPLVTRMLEHSGGLRENIARVLSFDYLGALFASLAFPLLLLPTMGSMRTAFLTGLINWAVGLFNLVVFRNLLQAHRWLWVWMAFTGMVLTAGFLGSYQLITFADGLNYQDKIIYKKQTTYQDIVVTRWQNDTRLYLNGNLQFSSVDEYRYHEALVHLPMLAAPRCDSVLILGGGDGLALREVLKHPGVLKVDLVDIDPEMVEICKKTPVFTELNHHSLETPLLQVFNEDGFKYVQNCGKKYNVVLIDLPDPSEPALAKLYSDTFYRMLARLLTADGCVVTQSSSPFFARNAFWCIHQTLRTQFPVVTPYQAYVPSFGLWGYNLAFMQKGMDHDLPQRIAAKLPAIHPLRYLTPDNIENAFRFDADTGPVTVEANTLEKMILTEYYSKNYWEFQ